MDTLNELRAAINALDEQIMVLLDSRFALSGRVGLLKRRDGIAVEDTRRETAILARCETFRHPAALTRVYRAVLAASKDGQTAR